MCDICDDDGELLCETCRGNGCPLCDGGYVPCPKCGVASDAKVAREEFNDNLRRSRALP
jgi:hypothetical protein